MLRIDQEGHDPELAKIGKQLMNLQNQLLFLWHCRHVAIEAINDNHRTAALLDLGRGQR